MSYNNLSVSLTPDAKAGIIQKINEVKAALPFLINLTTTERVRLRKVAEKRQGYLNDVVAAVKANLNAIPPTIDPQEYFKDAELYFDLLEIYTQILPLCEGLSDTFMAAGNEAITTSDQCYNHLQIAARGNANLKETVKHIRKHFDGQGKKKSLDTPQA